MSYVFTFVIAAILLWFWLWLCAGDGVNEHCFPSFPLDLPVCLCLPACPSAPHEHQPLLLRCVTLWAIVQWPTGTLCLFSNSLCFLHCLSPPQQPSPLHLTLESRVHSPALCLTSWPYPAASLHAFCSCLPTTSPSLVFFSPVLFLLDALGRSLPTLLCSREPGEECGCYPQWDTERKDLCNVREKGMLVCPLPHLAAASFFLSLDGWTMHLQVVRALCYFQEISLLLPRWEPMQEGFWLHFRWCWPAEWQPSSLCVVITKL